MVLPMMDADADPMSHAQMPSHMHNEMNCLIVKSLTWHMLADFFIMTSQSNGPSNGFAANYLEWRQKATWKQLESQMS